jgi:hypothetical protein
MSSLTGAMKYLAERYDLTKTPMVGASGGALASVLASCGVPADRVISHAFDLSVKHNIWERSLGLMGVWGAVVEEVSREYRYPILCALRFGAISICSCQHLTCKPDTTCMHILFTWQWLNDLLPDNAHELCRDRVTVVVTTLPDMAQVGR